MAVRLGAVLALALGVCAALRRGGSDGDSDSGAAHGVAHRVNLVEATWLAVFVLLVVSIAESSAALSIH